MTYSIPYKDKGNSFKRKKMSKKKGSLSYKKYFIRKKRYEERRINAIKHKNLVEAKKKEREIKKREAENKAKKDIQNNYPNVSYDTAIYIYKIITNGNINYNLEKDISIKKPKQWHNDKIKDWCLLHQNLISLIL